MLQRRQNQIMMNILKPLCSSRIRISVLLTVSILAMLFCCINLPIVYVGLIEALALAGCIAFFRKVDVTQYELFQYKPHWFWRICEWYWTIWFSYNTLPFIQWLGDCYPTLKYAYFVYPSVFKPITDFAISNFGKVIAVRYLSTIMLSPIIILSMPIIYYGFRWLFKQIAEFFHSFTKFEKYFLAISSSVLVAILFIVSSKTSFFVYPVNKDIYISENSNKLIFHYTDGDSFFNADNFQYFNDPRYIHQADSFRHPAYAFAFSFFMPLITVLGVMCNFYFTSAMYSYASGTAIVQIFLYLMAGILIKRVYESASNYQFANVILFVYTCSFPVVFVLLPERLIISLFFLVASLNSIIGKSNGIKSCILSFLAVFTTSLSIVPILLTELLNKRWRLLFLFSIGFAVLIVQRNFLLNNNNHGINQAFNHTSFKTPVENLLNFNQFLCSSLIAPNWTYETKTFAYEDNGIEKQFSSIWINQGKRTVCETIFGFIILILCVLTFCISFKFRIIQISFLWLFLSILIVGIIGFGHDCSVLYCSYFSWAIIPLALLPFYWLWQKFPRLPIPQALYLFAAYLAISNLYFIYQVVQIVSERYIVPPGM